MKRLLYSSAIFLFIFAFAKCKKDNEYPRENYDEQLSGGTQTVFDATSTAFSNEFTGLTEYDALTHEIGDGAFEQSFVTAPSTINNGLGPAFNNVSCRSCHHNDGIGVPTAG